MTLAYILIATLAGGLLSVTLAALLTVQLLSRLVKNLVSLSAGVLLGTALLHVLPEAFEGHKAEPHALFAALLGGLLFFWLLEKAELYRHVHHHEGDGHHHHHHFDAEQAGRGGFSVLVGDGIHTMAAAVTQPSAAAIVAHEIPQEAGDYIVLLNAGFSRGKALLFNALSGLAAVAGGVLGYFLLGSFSDWMPYLLVVASSSFIYVAVADLLPQLQQRLALRETAWQVLWIGAGLGVVLLARTLLESGHAH
jgi:zinc and cadmium transporter